ncbi:PFL_4669 family integrating conjugative element protein [Sedimenticola selenatireducens]|uniref:PFL_4669 family integrating conjugative element protein n=1 Tax=Sedimenticola selenatireducens TaxID=191960 RepID=UPI0004AEB2DF|nr:TIGR03761 family integrating conjugative element protein [Sedimenticola selenatireducens]
MRSDTPASTDQIPSLTPQPTLGALRGQAWLTVQTRQAQRLIQGRNGSNEKPAIIGLVGFADRLRLIWQAARNDDPYADWWLIRIHEAIDQARELVRRSQSEIDEKLAQSPSIEVRVAASLRPYRIPLQFANPYAYQGAHLIGEYDTLVRTLLSGCHVGLLDRASTERSAQLAGRRIRGVFLLPQSYRFLGIDRASVQRQDEKAKRAQALMGDLPPVVLSGEQQAPEVPRKLNFPEGYRKAATETSLRPVPDSDSRHGEE